MGWGVLQQPLAPARRAWWTHGAPSGAPRLEPRVAAASRGQPAHSPAPAVLAAGSGGEGFQPEPSGDGGATRWRPGGFCSTAVGVWVPFCPALQS